MSNRRKSRNRQSNIDPKHSNVWLYGLHAVRQALANSNRKHRQLILSENAQAQVKPELDALEQVLKVKIQGPAEISALLPQGSVHQGCALETSLLPQLDLEDYLDELADNTILVVLDQVTDPQNVGAILRSCAAFDALCLVVQQRHSPPETGALAKAASGALDLIPYIQVPNLARSLDAMADHGVSLIGLADEAEQDLPELIAKLTPSNASKSRGPLAIILGAEGVGLRALTRKKCTYLANLPTSKAMPSLNVSNAAAVTLYALRAD